MTFKNEVLKAFLGVESLEFQMLHVAEMSTDLTKAIFEWHRAYKKYWKCSDDADDTVRMAISRVLKKAAAKVSDRAMEVLLMIDILKMLQPADYVTLYEERLKILARDLKNRGAL